MTTFLSEKLVAQEVRACSGCAPTAEARLACGTRPTDSFNSSSGSHRQAPERAQEQVLETGNVTWKSVQVCAVSAGRMTKTG